MMQTIILENGKDPQFNYYRRPGIASDGKGTLLLYYEAQSVGAASRQSLFCRRSSDGGKSWSDRILLAEGGESGMLHNMMMGYFGNRWHCFYQIQYRRLKELTSTDGLHWEAAPDMTGKLTEAETAYPWDAFGIGSGHIVSTKDGVLLIPTWWTKGGDTHKPSAFANIWSDDGFRTVHVGEMIEDGARTDDGRVIANPNEGAVAETADGVLVTIRHDGPDRARLFAKSKDGCGAWGGLAFRPDLPDPICHAALIRDEKTNTLYFANCANADEGVEQKAAKGLCKYAWSNDARKNLTIRSSHDDGAHFTAGTIIADKGGYCDMAVTEADIVAVYETGWDEEPDTCVFPKQLAAVRIAKGEIL